jgi:transposase
VADADSGWTDTDISAALDVSVATIERVRQRCIEEGIEACLKQRRSVQWHLLNGEQEAHLVALACSSAPTGRTRWTLRLLRDQLVALEIVESISHETVRQTLKKRTQAVAKRLLGDSA